MCENINNNVIFELYLEYVLLINCSSLLFYFVYCMEICFLFLWGGIVWNFHFKVKENVLRGVSMAISAKLKTQNPGDLQTFLLLCSCLLLLLLCHLHLEAILSIAAMPMRSSAFTVLVFKDFSQVNQALDMFKGCFSANGCSRHAEISVLLFMFRKCWKRLFFPCF